MKSKWISFAALLLALALLAGCGASAAKLRDDVAVDTLADKALSCLAARADLVRMKDAYVAGVMGIDTAAYADYAVYISAQGTNMDEFGVFRLADPAGAAAAEAQLRAYLQMREDTWMNEYTPEEHPKLQNAQVKVLGSYLVYGILSDSEREAVFAACEDALKG